MTETWQRFVEIANLHCHPLAQIRWNSEKQLAIAFDKTGDKVTFKSKRLPFKPQRNTRGTITIL